MQSIKLSDYPEIFKLIRTVDSTYRKRNAYIYVSDFVALDGTYWDGGSRYTYHTINLATRKVGAAPQYAPPQFGGPRETPQAPLISGAAIVRIGIFCGKTATVKIYLHPEDAAHLLPAH